MATGDIRNLTDTLRDSAPLPLARFGAVMTLLIDLAFMLTAALLGASVVGLVCWLRIAPAAPRIHEDEQHYARDTLARLQDLTRRVAADLDQHVECVEEI